MSELDSIDWCDVQLQSIAWETDGRDVVIRMSAGPTNTKPACSRVVTCQWAEGLKVQLETKANHGGYPLTWDGAITALPDGGYSLLLDFGGGGEIRLSCAEIVVEDTPV